MAERTPLAMGVAAAPAGAVDRGAVDAGARVRVTVYLSPGAARVAGLDAFLVGVQTPGSGMYRQWLTPAEFGARFGVAAAQVAAVGGFLQSQGLTVEAVAESGLAVSVTGTATQMEAAFAPGLHAFVAGGRSGMMPTAAPVVPDSLAGTIVSVEGFDTLTAGSTTLVADGGVAVSAGLLGGFRDLVMANVARVVALQTAVCAETIAAGDAAAFALMAKQAAAQGMTVIAGAGCSGGSVSFPGTLAEVMSVAVAPGLAGPAVVGSLVRPEWQVALGLPANGLRVSPDLTAVSVSALAEAMEAILARVPADATGRTGRLGNVNATMYALGARAGIYTQADGAASGTWEPTTGLGLVDLAALTNAFPLGTLSNNVSISASNYSPTHGQMLTLTSSVMDTSGMGAGVVPTGTIVFTNSGVTIGSAPLVNGTASLTLNTLMGGPNSITASYSGDGTYQAGKSIVANISVQREAASLSAAAGGSVPVGGTITITVTATAPSGVGTPAGTISATQQGTSNNSTYTATLVGTNGTATATVMLPAAQAGNIVVLVSCSPSDANFSCYNSIQVNATVTQAGSATTLTVAPNPPVTGQTTTFTAKVTGAASPAPLPTGNVNFYDNGALLGTGTLTNGTATYTNQSLSGTVAHNFTASYVGDNNYTASNASGTTTNPTLSPTTTTVMITPNPPIYGKTTTLVATIAYTTIGTFPTGVVTFYQDGVSIGTAAVASNATATFTSTIISGTTSHTFYAVYAGDTNYAASTAPAISTQSGTAATTSTSLTISPNPPVNGSTTTLTATVSYTTGGTAATGTVQFYQDGILLGAATINAAGVATFTSTTLDGTATHSYYAKYLGDANYVASQSPTVVTQPASSTGTTTASVVVSTTTPTQGTPVTFTATVTPAALVNNTAPTGTVSFYSSSQGLIGTAALNGSTATLTAPLTTTGSQAITVTYSGDTNYKTSTSTTTPVTVTVTASQASQILTVSPVSPVAYGTTITATVNITGIVITSGTLPVGTETIVLNNGTGTTAATTATVALVATSATTALVTYTFAAPTPGTYSIQATCLGTNFSCSITPAIQSITVVKGYTTTTVTASPSVPTAGAATLLTATIAPVAPSTNPTNNFTGMVTFYNNGVSLGTGVVTGNMATFSTTLNTTTANQITATYSGDTNWNPSTSTALSLVTPPVTTIGSLSSSVSRLLQGSNVIFTATISVAPTTTLPTPPTPYGTVTFYDQFNGQIILLGTGTLVNIGPYLAQAQLSTTGLLAGTHTVTAVFASTTVFAGTTTNALVITVTDYALTFTPATLTVNQGQPGYAVLTVAAVNGFTGTVVLGCTPPSGASTTCMFSPSVINTSGTSTLVITTTASTHAKVRVAVLRNTALGLTFAGVFGFLLVPRRRRGAMLALVALCGLLGASGCTVLNNTGGTTTTTTGTSGTPLGTGIYTIVTSGSDGVTTNRHNLQYQVTVQ